MNYDKSFNINQVRERALRMPDIETECDAAQAGLIYALVYLGDAIRETTGDIGPALEKGFERINAEMGSIAQAVTDVSREMPR